MGIAENYLPLLDQYNGLLDTVWGLRPFTVYAKVIVWPSSPPGQNGSSPLSTTLTPLLCDGGNVYARHLFGKEIIASGGLYEDSDWKVGPLTPSYTDPNTGLPGGVTAGILEPPVPTDGTVCEIIYYIKGPGMADATNGDAFKLVEAEVWNPMEWFLLLRKTGQAL
jgi:hypothetical protein